jgi:benzoyl-CoA reductase/2-hydroxyglutaryl-CoA dehydratase subunit BcrC/BadD/HgdB
MITVGYSSPYVPPEWIASHGLQPLWVPLGGTARAGIGRGLCPYAEGLLEAATAQRGSALVMATTCDQVRHAAAVLETRGPWPVFLLNVPATWESPAARRYYQDELLRLGRFLVELGGRPPLASGLADVMLRYDRARSALRGDGPAAFHGPARRWAEAILAYRSGENPAAAAPADSAESPRTPGTVRSEVGGFSISRSESPPIASGGSAPRPVPLALVGGPLPPQDYGLLDLVEQCGGRIVLDASESGERTLPPPLRPEAVRDHPLEELADAYFLGIPDVFRRPNDRLYEWLAERIASRGVRGLLLRRYVWCDLWHAEWRRLAAWSPVPVLELDVADNEQGPPGRALGRIEAFLETLRHTPGRPATTWSEVGDFSGEGSHHLPEVCATASQKQCSSGPSTACSKQWHTGRSPEAP